MSKPPAQPRYLSIGQLAARTGVSAKALRLYERHGLLRPDAHSEAGYRLYGPAAASRLRQILQLKRAGFRLAEIAGMLARDAAIADTLLRDKLAQLRADAAQKSAMARALERLLARIDSASTLDQLLESIQMTTQLDVDLTPAQRQAMQQRLQTLGDAGIKLAEQQWPQLIARAQSAIDRGLSPDSGEAQACARRWKELADMATGGDSEVAHKIGDAWKARPEAAAQMGMTPELMRWIGQAMQAAGVRF